MRDHATVSVEFVQALLRGAAVYGVHARHVLAIAGLDLAFLNNPDARVAYSKMATVWEELPRRVGDESFGLRLAQELAPSAVGLLGYICRHSADVGTLFGSAVLYQKLLNEAACRELEVHEDTARILQRKTTDWWPRHLVEFALGMLVMSARQLSGEDLSPSLVAFSHPRPADLTEHERVFRGPIRFGQPHTEMVFDRAVLECPIQNADPVLFALLVRYARQRLARMPRGVGIADEARRRVSEAIPKGLPEAAAIARGMGMSVRSLDRQLRKEHTGYREVVDSVRRELSASYLRESQLGPTEIACLVGFSEVSTFYRAFRRWTGMTPLDYRRRHATT